MKNGILIKTDSGAIATEVKNFSKENVINAICKITGTKPENVEQLSASMNSGIYGFKTFVRDTNIEEIKEFRSKEYPFNFDVDYINIL